jgi:hypothetical protein
VGHCGVISLEIGGSWVFLAVSPECAVGCAQVEVCKYKGNEQVTFPGFAANETHLLSIAFPNHGMREIPESRVVSVLSSTIIAPAVPLQSTQNPSQRILISQGH